MNELNTKPVSEFPEPNYWGSCPTYRRNDGYRNLGRQQWCFCDAHRTRWLIGDNLFSSWRYETEEDWRHAWAHIGPYRVVEPYYWSARALGLEEPQLSFDLGGDVPF